MVTTHGYSRFTDLSARYTPCCTTRNDEACGWMQRRWRASIAHPASREASARHVVEQGLRGEKHMGSIRSIVIRCPNTGQEVPPGFETAEALCDAAILIDNPSRCPACGQLHQVGAGQLHQMRANEPDWPRTD